MLFSSSAVIVSPPIYTVTVLFCPLYKPYVIHVALSISHLLSICTLVLFLDKIIRFLLCKLSKYFKIIFVMIKYYLVLPNERTMQKNDFLNCWEFKECGREPDGKNSLRYGVCPVAIESEADGIYNGKNGGRCCWVLTDSALETGNTHCFCRTTAGGCRECGFYLLVDKSEKLFLVA